MVDKTGEQQLQHEASAPNQTSRRRPLSIRLMISAAVSIAVVLLTIIIARQPEVKKNHRIGEIIRNSMIGILSFYLIIAHAKDVMIVLGFMDKAVEEAQQRSAEKGKRAAQAMKTLDAFFEDAEKAEKSMNTEPGRAGQEQH
jgi:hypothetical protein